MDLDQDPVLIGLGNRERLEAETDLIAVFDQGSHGLTHLSTVAGMELTLTLSICDDSVMEESLAGRLLLATPRLIDPNFYRTVVLLLQHDQEGTVGIVLNRPTAEKVADHLPGWGERTVPPGLIHFGGPVEPEVAIGISPVAGGEPTGVPGLSIIDLSGNPAETESAIRVYSGYSGWGASQLESELTEGSWYVVPASPDDPFDSPDQQWSSVLRRQHGHLALVSTYPDDVSLN